MIRKAVSVAVSRMFKNKVSPQPHIEEPSLHTSVIDATGQPRYAKSSYNKVCSKGALLGELTFLGSPYRSLSAVARTDCLVIVLNLTAFNMVVKDRLMREQDEVGSFVFNILPGLRDFYSFNKVKSNAYILFKPHDFYRDETIVKEQDWND